jgi:hypothetical protein
MIGLLDGLKIGAGAVLGAALIVGPAYLYGKNAGKAEAAVAALEHSVKALRERSATDDEISRSDLAGLCRHLGLLPDDERECLRRLAEAQHEAGDGAVRDAE